MENPGLKESASAIAIASIPQTFITSTSFIGVAWKDWVYILTAVYTLLSILWFMVRKFPKLITCISCLWKNHKCDSACKIAPTSD